MGEPDDSKPKKRKSGASAVSNEVASPAKEKTKKRKSGAGEADSAAQLQDEPEELPELLAAAQKGDVAALEAALKSGAEVNETSRGGYTALHFAAGCGHADIVSKLIAAGAKVGQLNRFGQAALHLAVLGSGAATSCVELLLEGGADLHGRDGGSARAPGRTALELAQQCGAGKAVVEIMQKATRAAPPEKVAKKTNELPFCSTAEEVWTLLLRTSKA
ncbi:unnamed protein product [Polarella glacialis]|uniref:Uncharacterized protein n=1 Tax=Polarella glacialis TaxID=89957 RepID=A0A813EJ95_POLGL|nr:unnamed protein product [Polarella glacialis]